MIKKIISGGQPGVEIAALDAAMRLDIPHEGWCYKGRKTESGILSEQYNLKEIDTRSYFQRLEKNVKDSEGVVVLNYGQLVIGSRAVKEIADKYRRPCLNVDLSKHPMNHAIALIRKWMTKHDIATIYFTGTKTGGDFGPNVYDEVIQIVESVCGVDREQLLGFQEEKDDPPS